MRIFVQSTVFLPTPAPGAGAVEYLVGALARELARRGNEVHLFALTGSGPIDGVKIHTVNPYRTAEITETVLAGVMAEACVTEGFPDVIFDHSLTMQSQRMIDAPSVSMCHGMSPITDLRWAKNWVFTTEHHGRLHDVPHPRPLYPSIDPADLPGPPETPAPRDYLFWAGRIRRQKQPLLAVKVARAAGVRLIMAGPVDDHALADEIEDWLTDKTTPIGSVFLGPTDHADTLTLMRDARATLFTSDDQEPAGLVMIESQAVRTPVIASNHGANPELIYNGILVKPDDIGEWAEAVRILDTFPLWDAAVRFTIEGMGEHAVHYLTDAVAGERW